MPNYSCPDVLVAAKANCNYTGGNLFSPAFTILCAQNHSKVKYAASLLLLLTFILVSWKQTDNWLKKSSRNFTVWYTRADKPHADEYARLIATGTGSVTKFFGADYQNKFFAYVHPGRASLDSTWQKDWNMPGFKSACWMVASGVASRIDMLSPAVWNTEACEHDYADKHKTQLLITHELVHVYHGQLNVSKDFSDVDNIDWFVEGLATYVSGQYDAERAEEVKKAVAANTIPSSLDSFWTGNLKYGLSGSVVWYIDKKFGREVLKSLLVYNKKQEILQALHASEGELMEGWKAYIMKGK